MLASAFSVTQTETQSWAEKSCCGWYPVLQGGRASRLCICRVGILCHLETGRFARKDIRIWKGPFRDRSGDIPEGIVWEMCCGFQCGVCCWVGLALLLSDLFGVLAEARIRGAMVTQHWGLRGVHTALAGSWKTFPKQLPQGVNSSFLCQGANCFGVLWYYSLSGLVLLFWSTYCCICGGVLLSLDLRFCSLVSSTVCGMYLAVEVGNYTRTACQWLEVSKFNRLCSPSHVLIDLKGQGYCSISGWPCLLFTVKYFGAGM